MPDRVAPQAGTWPVRFRPDALRPTWSDPRPFWVWEPEGVDASQ